MWREGRKKAKQKKTAQRGIIRNKGGALGGKNTLQFRIFSTTKRGGKKK